MVQERTADPFCKTSPCYEYLLLRNLEHKHCNSYAPLKNLVFLATSIHSSCLLCLRERC
ncbi:hypothetical protein X975_02546, partial [Stegodyphus mimosarum]